MPIRVGDILTRASITLNDEDFVRWTKPELLAWVNDGACEIVLRRPAARAITGAITMVAGAFQTLPDGGLELLELIRNDAGRNIKLVDRQLLDAQVPDWRSMKPTIKLRHFMFNEATPTTFYVYPPAVAGHVVYGLYSAAPPEVFADEDLLQLDRAYIGPIVGYVMYRCLAKDSEFADGTMAAAHFQAFAEALGSQNQVTETASPNVRAV